MNKTCADCIHNEICLQQYSGLNQEMIFKECKRFKDKSRCIEPPCVVGDTVYSFCDVFGVILPYVIQDFKIGFLGKDRPNYWYWEATSHATETDELLDEIDFDLDDIGKTVFLTKEEAEQALSKELDYVKAKDLDKNSPEFKEAVKSLNRL